MQKEGKKVYFLILLSLILLTGFASAWSVDITNPVNGSYFGIKPPQFSWNFSGIDLNNLSSNLEINVNGNNYPGPTSSSNQAIGSLYVIQGWNTLILSVKNVSENETKTATLNFWVDSIDPILTVLNPLGIGYTNTNTLNLIVNLFEVNPGYYSGTKEIKRTFNYPDGLGIITTAHDLDANNDSDVSHILTTLSDQQEGKYSYKIYAKDKYPNGSTIREISEQGIIIRDTLSPITLIDSPSAGLFYAGIVSVVSSANDDASVTADVSGVNNITINITDGLLYSQLFSSDSSPLNYNWDSMTGTGDGNYNIEVTSYDRAGNSDLETITIFIDNTAPTITDDYVSDGIWTNVAPQLVTLTPSDLGSGINNTKYCEGASCTPNTLLNSPYQLNYATEQDTIVRYRAWDNVANPSLIGEYNVKIDLTAPTTTNNAPAGWQNSDVTVTLNPTDTLSGVANTLYQIDGSGFSSGTTILVNTEGTHTLDYYSIDNAGNAESTNSVQVLVDKSVPATTDDYDGLWHIFDFNVVLNAIDAVSGINYINYSYNGAWQQVFASSTSILINQEGNLTLKYYAVDNAGNIENSKTIYVALDKEAPLISLTGETALNNSYVSQNWIFAEVGASDSNADSLIFSLYDLTGILLNQTITTYSTQDITWAGLADGAYYYNVIANDLSGKSNNTETRKINLDATDPTITSFQVNPSQNISENNPIIINATDVSDVNLDFTGLMFVDSNNLISSDQTLFLANMNDTPISGPYGPISWNADYFKITDGTISEPAGIFITDWALTEYIVMGYHQNDSATEDCMLGFNMSTNELTTSYCGNAILDGVSKFTIKSLKFTNGIYNSPSEINGSVFTLYTIGNPANPELESTIVPTGDYNLILQAEDSAGNDRGEILNISVDNTAPTLTNSLSSSAISPLNADGFLDDLTITMNASELVQDWGTTRVYDILGNNIKNFNSPAGSPDNIYGLVKTWDGTLTNGLYAQDGIYTINTTITDYAGNSATIFIGSIIVDNTLPALSSISATSITSSSASIIWTTDENANSNVSYGTTILTTSNLGSATQLTSHSIGLSSLSASTFYYFNISSCDAGGNCNFATQLYNFTTSAQESGSSGGSGGSGGGSSGGSSSSKTYYTCSEWGTWSECSNEQQTRTCLEKKTTTSQNGVILSEFKDKETKSCVSSALTPLANTNPEIGNTNINSENGPTEKTSRFTGRITGAITGAVSGLSKSKSGKTSLIVVAVLAFAFGSLVLIRKRINKNKARKIKIIHKSDLAKRNV